MSIGNRAFYLPLSSMAAADIPEDTFGDAIITHFNVPVRILIITNATNQGLFFSYDGINIHSYIPANSPARIINYGGNRDEKVGLLEQPAQYGVFAMYENTAPTTGSVYVEVVYATGAV